MKKLTAILLTALLVVAACSTDPEEEATDDTPSTTEGDSTETSEPEESDDPRAPGVTDDTIKVGVTYPDLEGVEATLGINHGDYEVAYNAVADFLNEQGAFGDRQIEVVFAPVDPRQSDAATAACTRLAQDEEVFVTLGFFQGDEVLCYVDTEEVPVIGGAMNEARLEAATVPWFTLDGTEDLQVDAVEELLERDALGNSVGVIGTTDDIPLWDDKIGPLLDDADLDVAAGPAYIDNSSGDENVVFANADTILDRFEAEGVEQILVIGEAAALVVAPRVSARPYAPQLVFADQSSISAFPQTEGSDVSSLEGSIAVGTFNDNERFDELEDEATTECVEALNEAGHTMIPLDEVPEGELRNAVSGFEACKELYLLAAIVDAAGPDLNFGTFRDAGYGLSGVQIPGIPEPLDFGPPPSADGDIPLIFFEFDAAAGDFVGEDV